MMVVGGMVEVMWGKKAEGNSLEEITKPLTSVVERTTA